MSKIFFLSMFALVLLGFLISTTINMYNDMIQIQTEYSETATELSQLRSSYEATVEERDALREENNALKTQVNQIQQAYETEKQSRLKAEADTTIYKGMLVDMMNKTSNAMTSSVSCPITEYQDQAAEDIIYAGIIPAGAGSIVTIVLLSLTASIAINSRRYKKRSLKAIRH